MINVNYYNFRLINNAPSKTEQLLNQALSKCKWRYLAASNPTPAGYPGLPRQARTFDFTQECAISVSGKSAAHPIATAISSGVESSDHSVVRNGINFAGTHLIIDSREAGRLDDVEFMAPALRGLWRHPTASSPAPFHAQ